MNQELLGSISFNQKQFDRIQDHLSDFTSSNFLQKSHVKKLALINEKLCDLILKEEDSFCLPQVAHFIQAVDSLNCVERYHIMVFEFWLNQYAELSLSEQTQIRSKIAGKSFPRSAYQTYFPIGNNKYYDGTHYVTAHVSPDLDTIVSSFWGWLDAFAARVTEGLHIWNVPKGPPNGQVELDMLFYEPFGSDAFKFLSRSRVELSLSGFDLLTQKGMVKKNREDLTYDIKEERQITAVVLVDEKGQYLGDWRGFDYEGVRQIINLFNTCLRWFEYYLQIRLIMLFSKEAVSKEDVKKCLEDIAALRIQLFEPTQEFSSKQQAILGDYLNKVLHVEEGLEATFDQFMSAMRNQSIADFKEFTLAFEKLKTVLTFSENELSTPRSAIFSLVQEVVTSLSLSMRKVRSYVDSLGVAYKVKTDVLGFKPNSISYRSSVEEIKAKIGKYPYLTVNYVEEKGRQIPLGVIHASDLRQHILGTVTLRDFSNPNETKVPPYFEIISAIDHHKCEIINATPATIHIQDVQSANVIVANLAFRLNDQYSFGNMSKDEVHKQLSILSEAEHSLTNLRLRKRLTERLEVMTRYKSSLVSVEREMMEYVHFIYAILDDTDLLTKVTVADVICMLALLNRLKSLQLGREVEVLNFDDLEQESETFTKDAQTRLMQCEELYSMYAKMYQAKEKQVEKHLFEVLEKAPFPLFSDTKIQNNLARVGQKKIFAKNAALFFEHIHKLYQLWYEECVSYSESNNTVKLHLMMLSTLKSAEELHLGKTESYLHQDELWIYADPTDAGIEQLKSFIAAFQLSPHLHHEGIKLVVYDKDSALFKELSESFNLGDVELHDLGIPIASLKYKAGTLNSRKTMITPFLPKQS